MAKKDNAVAKTKTKKTSKFVAFFKRIGTNFKEMWGEVKKLSWLSWKDLAKHTGAVLVFVIVCAILMYGLDTAFSAGVRGLTAAGEAITATSDTQD